MSERTSSTSRSPAPRRRIALAATLLGLIAAAACSSGREKQRTVDAELGHDLDLASTTGIELANRARGGTQVVSSIEGTPRSAPHKSARTAKATGHRRQRVATPEVEAPPATVMVADHEATAAATTEAAAGPEPVATAPEPAPSPGPMVVPEPIIYPAGAGREPGRGGGVGTVIGGVIGVVLRGGLGGIDDCDERGTHGRRGGAIGVGIPFPVPGSGTRWPGGTTFPRRLGSR